MRRVHVLISGRVQGVGFRYAAAQAAARTGVSGWVRNRADGTVEAEVQGTAEQVDAMLDRLGRGPRGARVDAVRTTDVAATDTDGFEVRDD